MFSIEVIADLYHPFAFVYLPKHSLACSALVMDFLLLYYTYFHRERLQVWFASFVILLYT